MLTTLIFRECIDGETLVDNQCQECPRGSYSFKYDVLAKCTPCPAFTDTCHGATIFALKGYWRAHSHSLQMMPCPYGAAACLGGRVITSPATRALSTAPRSISSYVPSYSVDMQEPLETANASPEGCAQGYEGPLCAICSEKYYFSTTTSTCITCKGNG